MPITKTLADMLIPYGMLSKILITMLKVCHRKRNKMRAEAEKKRLVLPILLNLNYQWKGEKRV